jgi:hypothetical protein
MPRLHLLPSRIPKFSEGRPPDPLPIKRGDIPLSDSRLRRSGTCLCPISAQTWGNHNL